MKLSEIIDLTNAKVVAGDAEKDHDLLRAFSSDLMSDVLTLDTEHILLITGLTNLQIGRTAEMSDIEVVLLARNKTATPEMIELANETGLVLLETPYSIYRSGGVLFKSGLDPVWGFDVKKFSHAATFIQKPFDVERRKFLIQSINLGIIGVSLATTGYGFYEARRKAAVVEVDIPLKK